MLLLSLHRLRGASLLYRCLLALHMKSSSNVGSAAAAAFVRHSPPTPLSSFIPAPTPTAFRSSVASSSFSAMSSPSSNDGDSDGLPRVDFDKTETVGSTSWVRLETQTYLVHPEKEGDNGVRKWDRVVRTTKQSEDSVDAVIILAVLKHDANDPTKDEVVCVKQFRPPVDGHSIELPAGLIDAGEDPGAAAEREFAEETGYIGKAVDMLPASYLSPGLTNESACLVRMEVDMTLERNRQIHDGRVQNPALEQCEKDRGLEKLLLPRAGLMEALNDLRERDGVRVFLPLYSLALGMSVSGEGDAASTATGSKNFPLVNLEADGDLNPTPATSRRVVSALRDSGFLLIKTPILPLDLQRRALKAASKFLGSSLKAVTRHPSDPKVYAMLEGIDSFGNGSPIDGPTIVDDLREWYQSLQKTRDVLLRGIAVGMGMADDPNFFVNLHDEDNNALRLLSYPPGDESTGNRCKEHSDYGTLTLLLTDGVGGLEAFIDEKWRAVPYVEGAVVVNIGSILSEWTGQQLRATLHRVAGPASVGSTMSEEALAKAVAVTRTSVAYFADPNRDVYTALNERNGGGVIREGSAMNVSDYIQWRSGGEGAARSGVAFTSTEKTRLGNVGEDDG
mmetsp:Transcript_55770/g.118634  ORF Transcript_55770/g.118634 Transcript_55770/m.118634 type:complete len:620 (-) Transcript_55770:240-2099(-)